MSVELYSEGRVVGYSAYEQYVKLALATDPNTKPATESEWLASTIAMGTSMILKVTATTNSYVDYVLPDGCSLCAANNIIGSFFDGTCAVDSTGWATKVTSYGKLLTNTSSSSPVTSSNPNEDYPVSSDVGKLSDSTLQQMLQYIKISDGMVLQPGTWTRNSTNSPYKNLEPNLAKIPTLRLMFSESITTPFYILLTGFTRRSVINGVSGTLISGSGSSDNPQDGDFLGPQIFPWGAKISFSQPASFTYYLKDALTEGSANVHIETDGDTLGTTISVDNYIHSSNESSDYLTITQTNDGGETEIDIDEGALISSGITHGTGIQLSTKTKSNGHEQVIVATNISSNNGSGIAITPESSTSSTSAQKISTNLSAGTGIKITNDSSSTKKTISSNIQAGSGIELSTSSSGVITIENIAPYYGGSTNLKPFYPGEDYTICWVNGWTTTMQHYEGTNAEKGGLNVQYSASYNDSDITQITISMVANTAYTYNGTTYNARPQNPRLAYWNNGTVSPDAVVTRHSLSLYEDVVTINSTDVPVARSILCYIRFNPDSSNEVAVAAYNALVNRASNKGSYKYTDQSNNSTGIWNLLWDSAGNPIQQDDLLYHGQGSNTLYGGSWQAVCTTTLITNSNLSLARNAANTAVKNWWSKTEYDGRLAGGNIEPGDLIITINSYADGYNNQFTSAGSCHHVSDTGCVFTRDINLELIGLIYQ